MVPVVSTQRREDLSDRALQTAVGAECSQVRLGPPDGLGAGSLARCRDPGTDQQRACPTQGRAGQELGAD
ncbi:hypothetical protein chiPu_0021598 [Chiloscyllium punctatum]|uniref:Uncharacterized protein n=1 Tax=Chiloscyllium punctatum TaxID=137246 RepID=A0A401RIG7_CHIPU|nr:hypothetical protein [Chiloscyllium punctatum]